MARFTVSRTGPVDESLDVVVTTEATGSLASEDGPSRRSLTFQEGSRSRRFSVGTVDDNRYEEDRTVTATVVASEDGSYALGSPSSARVTVYDDDDLSVGVTTAILNSEGNAVTEVRENVGSLTVRVTATTNGDAPPGSVFTRVHATGDTATVLQDFSHLNQIVEFTRSEWSSTEAGHHQAQEDYTLSIINDQVVEAKRETLTLVTTNYAAAEYVTVPGSIELTIVDDDEPTYALSVTPASIDEAGGVATVKVSTGGVTLAVDQEFELTLGGTATLTTDYTIASTTLTLTAGQTEVSTTVTAVEDTVDDDGETVVVTASLDGATVGAAQTITIQEPQAVPGEPTGLEAVADGQTAIDLRWTAPADAGTSAITGYRIEWSPDGESDWADLVEDTESTATTYSDEGLEPGTTRHYRVSAISDAGTGEPSNVAEATTTSRPEVTIAAGTSPVTEGTDATFVVSRTGSTTDALSEGGRDGLDDQRDGAGVGDDRRGRRVGELTVTEADVRMNEQRDDRDGGGRVVHGGYGLVGDGDRRGRRRFGCRANRRVVERRRSGGDRSS